MYSVLTPRISDCTFCVNRLSTCRWFRIHLLIWDRFCEAAPLPVKLRHTCKETRDFLFPYFSRPAQFAVRFPFPCTVHCRTSAVVWHQVSFLQWLNSKSPEKKICNPAYNASFASRWRTHQRFIVTSKSQTIIEDMLQPSGPAGCCYSCRLAACVFDMTSDNARYTNSYELRRTGCVILSLDTVQWPSLWLMSLSERKRKR